LNSIPIDTYLVRVQDPTGKDLVPADTVPVPGTGTISLSLRLPPLTQTMCGWVLRASEGLLTQGSFKKRWMILLDRVLLYYEDQFTLNECKGVLICDDVTAITEVDSKAGVTLKLIHGDAPGDNWIIRWDPSEPEEIQRMWDRKLRRALPSSAERRRETSPSVSEGPILRRLSSGAFSSSPSKVVEEESTGAVS
jgi:hypothetical protein